MLDSLRSVCRIGAGTGCEPMHERHQSEHQHDDDDAHKTGAKHFATGLIHNLKSLTPIQQSPESMLFDGESPQAILDDDDGTVDDQTETRLAVLPGWHLE